MHALQGRRQPEEVVVLLERALMTSNICFCTINEVHKTHCAAFSATASIDQDT